MPVSPKSQGTAFIKCNFFPPGLTFAAALVIAWDISSMCDLSLSDTPAYRQVFMPVNIPCAPTPRAPRDLMHFQQEKYKLANLFFHYPEDQHEEGKPFILPHLQTSSLLSTEQTFAKS